ncbi:MAG: hypothetical protein NXI30_20670 [bacterium]|nr:hypothetical protein [bacterium]
MSAGEPANAWRTLRFQGRNWLARFSAELEIETELPEGEVTAADPGRGDWRTELRTTLDARLLSDKSSRLRARFDPMTGVVRRLSQLSMGPRPDLKSYAFGPRGVARIRRKPRPGQPLEFPERWPAGQETFHAYDAEALGCPVVSSPAALAWWLTWGPAATTVRSKESRACYFLGKTLYRVEVEPRGTRTARVDYQIVRGGRSVRRRGSVPVERFAVVSRPIAGKLDETTIVAEISLDAENRLPWRFVMREGPFRIDVELERADLREAFLVPQQRRDEN